MSKTMEEYDMPEYDYLTNIKTYLYDLQDLVNEVIYLREENKSLKEQVKQYDEFLQKQLERNNEMTASIFKGLVGLQEEN